jgi:hypothetical protein
LLEAVVVAGAQIMPTVMVVVALVVLFIIVLIL